MESDDEGDGAHGLAGASRESHGVAATDGTEGDGREHVREGLEGVPVRATEDVPVLLQCGSREVRAGEPHGLLYGGLRAGLEGICGETAGRLWWACPSLVDTPRTKVR